MPPERIQKILASAGVASRRGAETLIASGRVRVDGHIAALGEQADAAVSRIEVDGKLIGTATLARVYLAMHKPVGVTSTVRDRHAARTVLDLVPPDRLAEAGHLFPVGRLDQDSEGLILITNDGDWAERVSHPRFGVEREYAVGVARPLDDEQRSVLANGIALDEGVARLRHLRTATGIEVRQLLAVIEPPAAAGVTWYRVTIAQGWKRQLRRMFAATGAPIVRLARVRIGPIRLGDLPAGAVRDLSLAEVRNVGGARKPAWNDKHEP